MTFSENMPDAITASRFFEEMSRTPQSSKWHGEGDVLAHTRMVVEALDEMPEIETLSSIERRIIYSAAWHHDIGKIRQTKYLFDELESPNHAPVGSRMAREELWLRHGMCGSIEKMQIREAIALLIRYHSLPPHIFDSPSGQITLHKIAANSLNTPCFSIKLLCMLSRADMMGRICEDKEYMLGQIELCEELAKEEGCYHACYDFKSEITRHAFINGKPVWKDMEMHDDSHGEVIVMSGLPGTGKDTWIMDHLPGTPMISLDEIRRRLKISPNDDQGRVTNEAIESAKKYLRSRQAFVWNATNITESTRSKIIRLCESYAMHVRIVYLETDWQKQIERNSNREYSVPQAVICQMLGKLIPPQPHEARTVEWIAV